METTKDFILTKCWWTEVHDHQFYFVQVEGSISMLRGKWKDTVERNQDGVVFLDLNPEYFGWIINYLRPKKFKPRDSAALAKCRKSRR